MRRWIVRMLFALALGLPLAIVALYFLNPFQADSWHPRERVLGFGIHRVSSESMQPTLRPDEVVFSRAGHYRRHAPRRGDIALVQSKRHGGVILQRVVGLPGERIAIRGGRLEIDGRVVEEPYVDPARNIQPYSQTLPEQQLPPGHYFMLGDNRDNSDDDRFGGPTRRALLIGKVLQ